MTEFEKALETFIERVMDNEEFIQDAEKFIEPLMSRGRTVSLAQLLVKLTAPGIPDIYQGTEIWDLSLVDPDNRRPVDYNLRRRLVDALETMTVEEVLRCKDDGRAKLWVLTKALKLRDKLGLYIALPLNGEGQDRAVAFSRGDVITVVPRLAPEGGDWGDTSMSLPADKSWTNVLTGERVQGGKILLSRLFERFPVALLA